MRGKVTLIGFGEAGSTFAVAGAWGRAAQVYDIKDKSAQFAASGVTGCSSPDLALAGSDLVLSVVTADQALSAAEEAAAHIAANALYLDLNSVAPDTKRRAATIVESAGGCYVDVAVMAPVHPTKLAVPLLVCGMHAAAGTAALERLGFTNVRCVGAEIGRASAIKMIRSVLIKGQEALTAEMMLAADAARVTDEVLASLGEEWPARADYALERMRTHGQRRAAEMEQAAATLEALGIEPVMTRGTIIRQREMAA